MSDFEGSDSDVSMELDYDGRSRTPIPVTGALDIHSIATLGEIQIAFCQVNSVWNNLTLLKHGDGHFVEVNIATLHDAANYVRNAIYHRFDIFNTPNEFKIGEPRCDNFVFCVDDERVVSGLLLANRRFQPLEDDHRACIHAMKECVIDMHCGKDASSRFMSDLTVSICSNIFSPVSAFVPGQVDPTAVRGNGFANARVLDLEALVDADTGRTCVVTHRALEGYVIHEYMVFKVQVSIRAQAEDMSARGRHTWTICSNVLYRGKWNGMSCQLLDGNFVCFGDSTVPIHPEFTDSKGDFAGLRWASRHGLNPLSNIPSRQDITFMRGTMIAIFPDETVFAPKSVWDTSLSAWRSDASSSLIVGIVVASWQDSDSDPRVFRVVFEDGSFADVNDVGMIGKLKDTIEGRRHGEDCMCSDCGEVPLIPDDAKKAANYFLRKFLNDYEVTRMRWSSLEKNDHAALLHSMQPVGDS